MIPNCLNFYTIHLHLNFTLILQAIMTLDFMIYDMMIVLLEYIYDILSTINQLFKKANVIKRLQNILYNHMNFEIHNL